MTSQPPEYEGERLKAAEAWWSFIARVLSFLAGLGITFWQGILAVHPIYWVGGMGLTMMGLPIAGYVAEKLDKR